MAAELVPRVFDVFVQGQRSLDRRQGGLGLGLAVARTLVELHGGTIEALSAGSGQGSTFIVRLPLATSPPPASAGIVQEPSTAATPHARIGRVMVVDDNRDALDMLVEALKEAGVEAFGTSAPLDALDLAAERHPQVAVLDIGLPQMDGFELARALRSRDHSGVLRLIALTGYGQKQDVAAAKAAGFDAFFTKPVEVDLLIAALDMPTLSSP
jgi:CheY-like chemotaxis protein